MPYSIVYTPTFAKNFKKIPPNVRQKALKQQVLLLENPFHPSFKSHKLQGMLQGYWSLSINYSYRIVFKIENETTIVLLDVGTHAVYR